MPKGPKIDWDLDGSSIVIPGTPTAAAFSRVEGFAEEVLGHRDFHRVDWWRPCPGSCGRMGYWFVDSRVEYVPLRFFCIWDGPSRTSGHFRIERQYDADTGCEEHDVFDPKFGCGWCQPAELRINNTAVRPAASEAKRMVRAGMSLRLRFTIMERDGFTCCYCGANGHGVKLHVDHVVAVVNGGTNDPSNLVTACKDCNLGKGARHLSPTQPEAKA